VTQGPGLHNVDPKAPVALVKWRSNQDDVAEVIELCNGFKALDSSMRVVIKPNLVSWADKYKFAPFGVLTTSVVIEGVVRILKDFGVSDITIAEGTAIQEEMGSAPHIIYDRLNYHYLTKKYGVRLSDLNQEQHARPRLVHLSYRFPKGFLMPNI
jgi:uncharacterized protein (DUF362 family)